MLSGIGIGRRVEGEKTRLQVAVRAPNDRTKISRQRISTPSAARLPGIARDPFVVHPRLPSITMTSPLAAYRDRNMFAAGRHRNAEPLSTRAACPASGLTLHDKCLPRH